MHPRRKVLKMWVCEDPVWLLSPVGRIVSLGMFSLCCVVAFGWLPGPKIDI